MNHDLGVDCVSRQAVEDAMYDATRAMDLNYGQIMEYIDKLPSVTPIRPKGHWTEEFNDLEGEVRFTCSSCGKYQLFGTDFCYHCGAKMESEE